MVGLKRTRVKTKGGPEEALLTNKAKAITQHITKVAVLPWQYSGQESSLMCQGNQPEKDKV